MKRVILVGTRGPRNAGGALRAVANFGPAELWLAAPDRPSLLIHPEFEQMAHGVENVAARVRVVGGLREALADCHTSIGFTARGRGHRIIEDWSALCGEIAPRADGPRERVALVFGSEESGLTTEEIELCERVSHIPTSPDHTSLNLAVAVALVLHGLFSGRGATELQGGGASADGASREFLKAHLKDVFGGQVARTRAARRDIEQSIDRVFSRAPLETRDARAWHLMLRALGSRKRPEDFGLRLGSGGGEGLGGEEAPGAPPEREGGEGPPEG